MVFGGVLEGVETCEVHAHEPVALGTGKACHVEAVVVALGKEVGEAGADGVFGKGGDPQSFYGAVNACELLDPALDELAFLTGIAAVDDFFCF